MSRSRAALLILTLGLACAANTAQAPDAGAPPGAAGPDAATAQPGPANATADVTAAPGVTHPDSTDLDPVELSLPEQQISNAARNRLDRARSSIVQIRGFLANSAASAFHGSGFAAGDEGLIVTNYHVVSEAVLHPHEYRLEYVTADGRTGVLKVHAVDVRNDLAVVKAEDLVDYTRHENVAEKLAKRFGAAVGEGAVKALRAVQPLR